MYISIRLVVCVYIDYIYRDFIMTSKKNFVE